MQRLTVKVYCAESELTDKVCRVVVRLNAQSETVEVIDDVAHLTEVGRLKKATHMSRH